jgi:hypothetical protein
MDWKRYERQLLGVRLRVMLCKIWRDMQPGLESVGVMFGMLPGG